jgi:ABC-type transport system involved in multi-copper enzyme maturation permease subunit
MAVISIIATLATTFFVFILAAKIAGAPQRLNESAPKNSTTLLSEHALALFLLVILLGVALVFGFYVHSQEFANGLMKDILIFFMLVVTMVILVSSITWKEKRE